MNIRFSSVLAVLATATAVFAADPAPAAVEVAAPAESAPVAVETAAPAETAPAAVEAAAPAAEVAAPVESAPAADSAPVAVETAAPASNSGVAPTPVAVRGADSNSSKTYVVESRPAPRTVVVQQAPQPETVPAGQFQGLEPQKLNIGFQAFVGSYDFVDDVFDTDASGMTWRVGVHTSLPLNQYTAAMKIGILYEQSDASTSEDNYYSTSHKIAQKKLYMPVLFAFKAPRSFVSFDIGTSVAIPLADTFSFVDRSGVKHKFDMIKDDQRASLDWNFLLGVSVRPHKLVSFDVRYELGFNKLYEDEKELSVDKSSNAFMMGLSFYPFSL